MNDTNNEKLNTQDTTLEASDKAETPDVNEAFKGRNSISRYKMREQAVLLVFEKSFSDTDIDELADNLIDSRDVYLSDYAINITKSIFENIQEIDGYISANLSKGWKISRISKVALAVLRVAVYEMKYVQEVPVSVAINEAVELAKKYSVDDASFINGVLGSIAKELK